MGPEEMAGVPQRPLPHLSEYLRATFALGRRSFQIALPALILLYCYRLLMNLFLALSTGMTNFGGAYSHGFDQDAFLANLRIRVAFYLPVLVLIYTPFLPLQDAILKGGPRSFASCARTVLERFIPFALSAIAQAFLAFGPPALLFGGVALLIRMIPRGPDSLVHTLAFATLVPCFFYVVIIGLFLVFATPSVVLENRGPLASIRVSFGLVTRHLGGILGRFFVFGCLLILAGIVLSIPEGFLAAISAVSGSDNIAFSISEAIWSAAVSVLLFPFSVAALMVLYRSVLPVPHSAEPSGAADPALARSTSSPFVFE